MYIYIYIKDTWSAPQIDRTVETLEIPGGHIILGAQERQGSRATRGGGDGDGGFSSPKMGYTHQNNTFLIGKMRMNP